MYLYSKDDDKINVFSLNPKEDLIEQYKKEEMLKIPEEKRVLKAVTNVDINPLTNFNHGQMVPMSELNFNKWIWFIKCYHELKSYGKNEQYKAKKVLEDFYKEMINYKICISPLDDFSFIYFMITKNYYNDIPSFLVGVEKGIMEGIIQIPESLYVLQNVYFGNGKALEHYKIDEHVDFFDFSKSPVASFNIRDIATLEAHGVIQENLTPYRLESNEQLIKRLINIKK